MGDQLNEQPKREVKSRWAASTDMADVTKVDDQGAKAAHAASSHQRRAEAEKAPAPADIKDNADGTSAQLLNTELVDLARELYKMEPILKNASNTIIELRTGVSTDRMDLDKDKDAEQYDADRNIESDGDKRQHQKLQSHLKSDMREKNADMKMQQDVEVADLEATLQPALVKFLGLMGKANSHGLHAKGLDRGLTYLKEVLDRFSTLVLWMGIESPALVEMKAELTRTINHLNITPAKDVKVDKLTTVTDDQANHDKAWLAISAALDQSAYAKVASDQTDLANAVALIQSSLGEAIIFAHKMSPDDRKRMLQLAHQTVTDGKAVDKIAISHKLNTPSLEGIATNLVHELSK